MIRFLELSRAHNRDNFDCGNADLNNFLRNFARQNLKKGLSRTFVAVDDKFPEEILGFYTLSLFEILAIKLPERFEKRYKGRIPAVKLARLAVAKGKQRQQLGKHMLINAIKRVVLIAEHAGVIGMFVDATNESAIGYYQKFGFMPLPNHLSQLFLPYATLYKMYVDIFCEE